MCRTRSRSEAAAAAPRCRRLARASALKVGEHSDPLSPPVRGVGEGPRPRHGELAAAASNPAGRVGGPLPSRICAVRAPGGTRARLIRGCGDPGASRTRARGRSRPVSGRPAPNTRESSNFPGETSPLFTFFKKKKIKESKSYGLDIALSPPTKQLSCLIGFSFPVPSL